MSSIPGVSDADLAQIQAGVPLLPNATVDIKRPGIQGVAEATVATGRRVHLRWPTEQERIMAAGAEVPIRLRDAPDAPYRESDIVVITALDRHTTLPAVKAYRVGLVEQLPYILSETSVQLTGEGSYQ